MAHPIYRFGEILRELRKDAGLTVLGAAEATEYGNYERWESGATRVGAQHLGAIAAAFGVDDVPMFLYAWLVDRFSPTPKQGSVDLAHANFDKTYRQLPRTTVDLGERKDWVVEPARHADVALLYLTARYRRNQRVVLPPVARKPLPARAADDDVLTSAYGDVIDDVVRLAARILIRAGRTGDREARAAVANLAPMLSKPEAFEALADEVGDPLAHELRRFARLSRRVRDGLGEVVALAGDASTTDAVAELAVRLAAGDLDAAEPTFTAAVERGALPDIDTSLIVDMEAMRERVESRIDAKVRREVVERSATLDLDDLFDALEVVTAASRRLTVAAEPGRATPFWPSRSGDATAPVRAHRGRHVHDHDNHTARPARASLARRGGSGAVPLHHRPHLATTRTRGAEPDHRPAHRWPVVVLPARPHPLHGRRRRRRAGMRSVSAGEGVRARPRCGASAPPPRPPLGAEAASALVSAPAPAAGRLPSAPLTTPPHRGGQRCSGEARRRGRGLVGERKQEGGGRGGCDA